MVPRAMNLVRALRISSRTRLALVGAGGKTCALFRIARQLTPPVVVTTTTHLARDQSRLADHHIILGGPDDITQNVAAALAGVTLLTGNVIRETPERKRLSGLDGATLQRLLRIADSRGLPLILEADGSRQMPLKAPGDHEPAIPRLGDSPDDSWLELVVVVAGLSGLGKPLTGEWVHRPERFANLSGLKVGSEITIEAVADVLCHPQGGLKNIPGSVRRAVILNQADTPFLQEQGRLLAARLRRHFHAVVVAALEPRNRPGEAGQPGEPAHEAAQIIAVDEPVAGIVLAAGRSRRYGEPKQLLPWRGIPMVRQVALTALHAGLDPVVVVTGAHHDQVHEAIRDLPIKHVYNPAWEAGQSTSVKAGLEQLPDEIGAAIFLLADQPQVPVSLVTALVEAHATTLSPLVAPFVRGRRANPVLFDRLTFQDLMKLRGDSGGRSLFSRYLVARVSWEDENLLLDVDSEEDYRNLLRRISE